MAAWRAWHRWFGTLAGFFLLFIVLSGTWLHIYKIVAKSGPGKAEAPAPVMAPIDPVALATRAQALAEEHRPGAEIVSLALDAKAGNPMAVVKYEGVEAAAVIDLQTGAVKTPSASPPKDKTTWRALHDVAMELHTLRFAGIGGHVFGLLLGVMLLFLTGSGLWMWLSMWRERVKRNKRGWLWY